MELIPGLVGVVDDTDLFNFLCGYRMSEYIRFAAIPSEEGLPIIYAADPANEAAYEKTLALMLEGPCEMFWFAVLETCDPAMVTRACNDGAVGVFFRDQWKPYIYRDEMMAIQILSLISLWRYKVIENILVGQDPTLFSRSDMVRMSFYEWPQISYSLDEEAFFLPIYDGEILVGEDNHQPFNYKQLKALLNKLPDQGLAFFDSDSEKWGNVTVGLSHVFERGLLKLHFVTYSPNSIVDPEADVETTLRQEWEQIHSCLKGRVGAYFKETYANLQTMEVSNMSGSILNFMETVDGVIDLYGTKPGESPYSFQELKQILKKRNRVMTQVYLRNFISFRQFYPEHFKEGMPIDLHDLWLQSHKQHFLYGPGKGPCGDLHYKGPPLPAVHILQLAFVECFRLFRFLASHENKAAEVTVTFEEQPLYWTFFLRDKSLVAGDFQRDRWLQVYPMEHPSLMLFEAKTALAFCGGDIQDWTPSTAERGNCLKIRCPKEEVSFMEYTRWEGCQDFGGKGYLSLLPGLDSESMEAYRAQDLWRISR